ncbi:MAG: hypothetical protein WCI27_10175 [Candidatus Omnitrophota bacterium]
MTSGLWKDIFHLAWHKKTSGEKLSYLCRGILFYPFLLMEQRRAAGVGDNEATSQSSSGDDVYPLF